MAANYGPYGEFGSRGYHVARQSVDGSMNLEGVATIQHDIVQQQLSEEANSPDRHEGRSSGSDPPTPPMAHQQTSNQPHAPHLSPTYPAPGLGGTTQPANSPNVPQSALGSNDYFFSAFSPAAYMSYPGGGISGPRHHSIE